MRKIFLQLIGIFLGCGLLLPGCAASPQPLQTPLAVPSPTVEAQATPTTSAGAALPTERQPATPTAEACGETNGRPEQQTIETPLLGKPLRYIVYLPPCYRANPTHRYPVLYLLHGQNYDETQWLRLGAGAVLDRLVTNQQVAPFILVFPYDFSFKQPAEYKFEEAFVHILVPQIDLNYRTLTSASQRAIGGLSRGGAWAIRLGTRYPELFGEVGGHSPAIFYADMDALPGRLLNIPSDRMPRFWLDAGDSDSEYETVVKFERLLNKLNVPHEWHSYVGWHDETYWSAHVEEYLRWYAAEWR